MAIGSCLTKPDTVRCISPSCAEDERFSPVDRAIAPEERSDTLTTSGLAKNSPLAPRRERFGLRRDGSDEPGFGKDICLESLKGNFILDSGKLAASFFARTVILVCQHDDEGAFGLVVNRATGNSLGEAIAEPLPESLRETEVYLGGPVQTDMLSFLHTDSMMFNANVTKDLALGHSLEELTSIAQGFSPAQRMKVFAGYSGWAAGQLEREMNEDSWLVHPASLELIFDTDPDEVWREILKAKGPEYRLLADAPDDPSVN